MKQSQLFTKTTKNVAKEEKSINATLLTKGGFIDKLSAGIYSYLPLGLKTLKKVEEIVREEMNAIGGQEILMPGLTPKDVWVATDRWDNFDALFKLEGNDKKEYALGATHEEVVTPLAKNFVFSYKDLPVYTYQIQTKFRNELRAKSGILRGREFLMKDLYSFHSSQEDLDDYYEKVKEAYFKVFDRVGLGNTTYLTYASGGAFSKYSHEFQTLSEYGEDIIYICPKCKLAYNKEIINEVKECDGCGTKKAKFTEEKAIETGNIFKLGTRFSAPIDFKYTDEAGKTHEVIMASYGIGITRVMGTVVEVHNDEKGIIWPQSIAPFMIHLVSLGSEKDIAKKADSLYTELIADGHEVLFDDREESAGVKLNDSDLIGIPYRIIISPKTLEKESVEVKARNSEKAELVKLKDLGKFLKKM